MSGRILVVGATGKTGVELVKRLTAQRVRVRAATRNPAALTSKLGDTVDAAAFDIEEPATFAPALDGVDRVFLMARPGDTRSHDFAAPFIDAAKQRGVRLIVNLTAMGAEQDASFGLRILETYLEASGIAWAHLRPNYFMQNFSSSSMLADIRTSSALHLPAGDAKLSFIDVRDIAAVAAVLLTAPQPVNRAYTLTGGAALDHYEVTSLLSRVAGKTIGYVPLSEDDARSMLGNIGWPPELVERQINFFRKVRDGFCAPVSPAVESVLGRAPTTFAQYASDYAASWK